jgi:hypothetical protein
VGQFDLLLGRKLDIQWNGIQTGSGCSLGAYTTRAGLKLLVLWGQTDRCGIKSLLNAENQIYDGKRNWILHKKSQKRWYSNNLKMIP